MSNLKVSLWEHQIEMLSFARGRNASLLYSGMSTGKTLVGLEYLREFKGLRLVLCPKRVRSIWKNDAKEFFEEYDDVIIPDKGTSRDKKRLIKSLMGKDAIIVLNYETASLIDLSDFNFSAVVADEAHALGAHDSKQSVKLALYLMNVPHKLCLTGTPYHDGLHKLYGIMRFLEPKIEKKTLLSKLFGRYNDFLFRYFYTYSISAYTHVPRGVKDIDALSALVAPYVLKVDASKLWLPEIVKRDFYITLSREAKRVYNDIDSDYLTEYEGESYTFGHPLSRAIRLQQLAVNGILTDGDTTINLDGWKDRIETLNELLSEIGNEPVVIFTSFKRDIEIISQAIGEPVALLTGDIDTHKEWLNGDYRILLANLGAGSEGIRLQRARYAIYWSVGYSLKNYEQSLYRIRRTNSEHDTVFIYHIVTKETIDEMIHSILVKKEYNKDMFDTKLKSMDDFDNPII